MCNGAVDDSIATLKLIPDWFVTSEMIKKLFIGLLQVKWLIKLFTGLHSDENILYFDEDPGDAISNCKGVIIFNINLNNISLYDKFDEDDPDTVIPMRLLAWRIKFRKRKKLRKELSEELMPVAWHPNRWWNCCVSEDEKKEIDPIFIEEL